MSKRPVPADFADHAADKTAWQLATHYHAGLGTVRRWIETTNIQVKDLGGPANRRPVPADFAKVAKVKHRTALTAHYRCTFETLARWIKESGIEPAARPAPVPHNRKPVPADFAAVAPTRTKSELCQYYFANDVTVNRWLAETGIKAKVYRPPVSLDRRNVRSIVPSGSLPKLWTERTYSEYDRAADILRRNRWIVYSCDERGRAMETGKFFRCGNVVCTPDELLARAARYERAA